MTPLGDSQLAHRSSCLFSFPVGLSLARMQNTTGFTALGLAAYTMAMIAPTVDFDDDRANHRGARRSRSPRSRPSLCLTRPYYSGPGPRGCHPSPCYWALGEPRSQSRAIGHGICVCMRRAGPGRTKIRSWRYGMCISGAPCRFSRPLAAPILPTELPPTPARVTGPPGWGILPVTPTSHSTCAPMQCAYAVLAGDADTRPGGGWWHGLRMPRAQPAVLRAMRPRHPQSLPAVCLGQATCGRHTDLRDRLAVGPPRPGRRFMS